MKEVSCKQTQGPSPLILIFLSVHDVLILLHHCFALPKQMTFTLPLVFNQAPGVERYDCLCEILGSITNTHLEAGGSACTQMTLPVVWWLLSLPIWPASAHSSSELANTFFPTSFRSLPLLLSKLKHCHVGQGVTIYLLQRAQTTLHITGPIQCSCPSSNLEMKLAMPSTRHLAHWSTHKERERSWAHSSSFPAPSSRQSAARAALTAFRNLCLQAAVGPTLASVWSCCGCSGEACPLSPHPEELRRHRIREEMGEPNSTKYPVTM